jgi:SAM-dependent methyltransferase
MTGRVHIAVIGDLPAFVLDGLRCPSCMERLIAHSGSFGCESSAGCLRRYPVIDGRPILIDDDNSVFDIASFIEGRPTFFPSSSRMRDLALRFIPELGSNLFARRNYQRLLIELHNRGSHPRVLVVGAGVLGSGMDVLIHDGSLELIETDVTLLPTTQIVCDAHALPFADGLFDAVIAQAVLEHVADPYRCVSEIHRVLKSDGIVYAETPFIQQVHGGPYDFTRFTYLGHRRLFRYFDEITSGMAGGPGMALAWSYEYFLISLAPGRIGRQLARIVSRFTAFWLKYLDRLVASRPAALDAASGYFFMGRRSASPISDRSIVASYPRR